jgi:hypothetical protein
LRILVPGLSNILHEFTYQIHFQQHKIIFNQKYYTQSIKHTTKTTHPEKTLHIIGRAIGMDRKFVGAG